MYLSQASRVVIGATLLSVTHDSDTITLETDRGTLTMRAEGDCCSHSWFESVDVDSSAIGGQVTEIEESTADHPGEDWSDGCERKVDFGCIKTTTGRIVYEMRNESNGYYGGYIIESWQPA